MRKKRNEVYYLEKYCGQGVLALLGELGLHSDLGSKTSTQRWSGL